jgi:hypothetical protein
MSAAKHKLAVHEDGFGDVARALAADAPAAVLVHEAIVTRRVCTAGYAAERRWDL